MALNSFSEAVKESLERMTGQRGDPMERVVTLGDLKAMGFDVSGAVGQRGNQAALSRGFGQEATLAGGATTTVAGTADAEAFARDIYNTRLFQDLIADFDDPARFAWVPDQLRKEMIASIAGEAAKRDASITSVQQIVIDATRQFASRLDEITARFANVSAGVREVAFAYADADRAIAANVTTVEAQINGVTIDSADILGVGGLSAGAAFATFAALKAAIPTGTTGKYYKVANPVAGGANILYKWNGSGYDLAGQGTSAGVEQALRASADRATGAEAQYTVKVKANGAVAGFGLAATDSGDGNASSAFIIQADKFAVVNSSYAGGLDTTPDAASVPFGVDGTGVYINGNVRINAGGTALVDLGSPVTYVGDFASAPSTAGRKKNEVYRNTTDGNTYILDADGGAWVTFLDGGTDGTPGAPGTSSYLHVKYSNDGGATFTASSGETVGTYMGTCVDTNVADPVTVGAYTWVLIKGADGTNGTNGTNGLPGTPGADGATLYTWVAYANDSAGSTGFTIGAWTNQTYIGLANNKTTATEGTNPADYTWSLIKGDAGVPGTPGADGTTTYTWFAYANDSAGSTGFSTGAWTNQTYIGLATNKTTATESTNPADYTWSLIKGADGATGAPGGTGAAGTRGSVNIYTTGTGPFTGAEADAAILAQTGSSTKVNGDVVTEGDGASYVSTLRWNGSWSAPGVFIDGSLLVTGSITGSAIAANTITAGKINSNGLEIKTPGGVTIFSSVVPLTATYADAGLINSNVTATTLGAVKTDLTNAPSTILNSSISISSGGTLSGGGGGSVTIGGLGYSGDLAATKNIVTYSSSAPGSPANGDIWVDTSVTPNLAKVRASGVWQTAANYSTNTNQLTDGANLGGTAAWSGVASRPANLAALTGAEAIQNSLITASAINALSNNSVQILAGLGGVGTGTVSWTSGGVASGSGVAFTANGLVGVNGGVNTFSLNASTGAATFLGSITSGSTISGTTISGSSLSVGSSPAVSGTTMTGTGGVINSGGTFALGQSSGNITYNGSQITLNGAVVTNGTLNGTAVSTVVSGAASGASAVQPAAISGMLTASSTYTLSGVATISGTGAAIKVGTITWNTTTGVVTGGTGFAITPNGIIGATSGTTKLAILNDGTATFAGALAATGGTFGTITGGSIDIGSGATSWHVDSAGNMWAGNAAFASAPFRVSNAGALTASSGTFSGTLSAAGGTLGTITSGTITGATVQTATSGQRVEITFAGGLKAYPATGAYVARMGPANTLGVLEMETTGTFYGAYITGASAITCAYALNTSSGAGFYGSSNTGSGIAGYVSGAGIAGNFAYGVSGPVAYMACNYAGSTWGMYTTGKIKSTIATGTAPIDVDSTTRCPNLTAAAIGDGTFRYQLSGVNTTGVRTATMPLNNKPGANNGGNNSWVKLTIDSTVFWVPVWVD
jgi:hypothetical protein